MGVRVVCPNGHRLHLKLQLAGRRGLCPDCGARFRIPSESSETPQPFAEPPRRPADQTDPTAAQPGVATAPVATPADDMPVAVPMMAEPTQPNEVEDRPLIATESVVPLPVIEQPISANVAPELVASPLDSPVLATLANAAEASQTPVIPIVPPVPPADQLGENPQALWFVQPPTGGRFGPAKTDILRQWIAEGRVNGDCLVWRDGWPEWRPASTILGSGSGDASSSVDGIVDVLPSGGNGVAYRRRTSSKGAGVAMLVILGLACLALLGVLFVLISNGTVTLVPPSPAK